MALDTRILNLASAEEFISKNNNRRWDGWEIVIFKQHPRAWFTPSGVYDRRTGQWGFETRISPDAQGNYTVMVRKPFKK